jgi:hypothetical protein
MQIIEKIRGSLAPTADVANSAEWIEAGKITSVPLSLGVMVFASGYGGMYSRRATFRRRTCGSF